MKALAVVTGIVFWTLVLGIAWLAFFPAGETGEPVAVLQIEPAPATPEAPAEEPQAGPAPPVSEAPAASPESPADSSQDSSGVELPPGFAPSGPPQAPIVEPPGQGQTLLPVAPAAPDDAAPPEAPPGPQGAAPEGNSDLQQAALEPTAETPGSAPAPIPPESETGSVTLPPAPVAELVEESQYGPLPKVASDGRRPAEVYARPSRYASLNSPGAPPRVAVLVTGAADDSPGEILKTLPPNVSVAYSAYGRGLQDAVDRARSDGHEVLLQVPLEPNNYPTEDPGPHTLLTTLPPQDNLKRLQWLMSRYTGYVGVTNLMGAKFESSAEALQPVFEEIKRRGLLYVDDGSKEGSPAWQVASALGLDYSIVSVQIDAGDVAKQLEKLEVEAKTRGAAIGVAKAKPATIKQLAEWANKLEAKGIVLVPVSAAVRSQRQS